MDLNSLSPPIPPLVLLRGDLVEELVAQHRHRGLQEVRRARVVGQAAAPEQRPVAEDVWVIGEPKGCPFKQGIQLE